MYFITLREGGFLSPVFDNRQSHIIVEELKTIHSTFICEFDTGLRYDTILESEGKSPWDITPSIEEKIQEFKDLLISYNKGWDN